MRQGGHKEELNDIQQHVDGEEGANPNVEAVAELQGLASRGAGGSGGRGRRGKETLLPAADAAGQEPGHAALGAQEAADEEVGQCGVEERAAEEVHEDEHQREFGGRGGGERVRDCPCEGG